MNLLDDNLLYTNLIQFASDIYTSSSLEEIERAKNILSKYLISQFSIDKKFTKSSALRAGFKPFRLSEEIDKDIENIIMNPSYDADYAGEQICKLNNLKNLYLTPCYLKDCIKNFQETLYDIYGNEIPKNKVSEFLNNEDALFSQWYPLGIKIEEDKS